MRNSYAINIGEKIYYHLENCNSYFEGDVNASKKDIRARHEQLLLEIKELNESKPLLEIEILLNKWEIDKFIHDVPRLKVRTRIFNVVLYGTIPLVILVYFTAIYFQNYYLGSLGSILLLLWLVLLKTGPLIFWFLSKRDNNIVSFEEYLRIGNEIIKYL